MGAAAEQMNAGSYNPPVCVLGPLQAFDHRQGLPSIAAPATSADQRRPG
jgi:hypothetical protein